MRPLHGKWAQNAPKTLAKGAARRPFGHVSAPHHGQRSFVQTFPSCVLKFRLLAEVLTQDVAARIGVRLQQPTQAELWRAVEQRLSLDPHPRQENPVQAG